MRQAADGEREIVTMSWGFMLLQKGGAAAGDERARRHDPEERVLEVVI